MNIRDSAALQLRLCTLGISQERPLPRPRHRQETCASMGHDKTCRDMTPVRGPRVHARPCVSAGTSSVPVEGSSSEPVDVFMQKTCHETQKHEQCSFLQPSKTSSGSLMSDPDSEDDAGASAYDWTRFRLTASSGKAERGPPSQLTACSNQSLCPLAHALPT
mgnify:CR=1 FL=1